MLNLDHQNCWVLHCRIQEPTRFSRTNNADELLMYLNDLTTVLAVCAFLKHCHVNFEETGAAEFIHLFLYCS